MVDLPLDLIENKNLETVHAVNYKKIFSYLVVIIIIFSGTFYWATTTDWWKRLNPVKIKQEFYYYELPDLLINLSSGNLKGGYLKLGITLELENPRDTIEADKAKPKILDQLNIFLREIQFDDLKRGCDSSGKGCGALVRLKEEIALRINSILDPVKISDVLFREALVQ